MATADHFESRSEDEDEYDLGEMETEAEEERDIFEMPPMSSIVGRAQRPGLLSQIMHALPFQNRFEPRKIIHPSVQFLNNVPQMK